MRMPKLLQPRPTTLTLSEPMQGKAHVVALAGPAHRRRPGSTVPAGTGPTAGRAGQGDGMAVQLT